MALGSAKLYSSHPACSPPQIAGNSLIDADPIWCYFDNSTPLEIAGNRLGHHKIGIESHYLNLTSVPCHCMRWESRRLAFRSLDHTLVSPACSLFPPRDMAASKTCRYDHNSCGCHKAPLKCLSSWLVVSVSTHSFIRLFIHLFIRLFI